MLWAYEDSWKGNVSVRKTRHALGSGTNHGYTAEVREVFPRLKARTKSVYGENWETDPEDSTRQGIGFTKELSVGAATRLAGFGTKQT